MNILRGPGRELVLIDEENRTHFELSEDESGLMITCERDEEGVLLDLSWAQVHELREWLSFCASPRG
jgi:hypothetical protein